MAPDQAASVPAGWYPDPYTVSDLRWWDGQNWTDSVHPPVAAPPSTPPPPTAPAQQAPVANEPVSSAPVSAEPSPAAAAPIVVEPPVVERPVAAPQAAEPAPAASADGLPSRRDLRARAATEGEPVAPRPSAVPVPDSSQPSSFDWLPNSANLGSAEAAPGSAAAPVATPIPALVEPVAAPAANLQSPPTQDPLTMAPPVLPAPVLPAPVLPAPVAVQPAAQPVGTDPVGMESLGLGPGPSVSTGSFAAPVASSPLADPAGPWARESAPGAGTGTGADDMYTSAPTRKSTTPGWFIALMPLIAGILVVAAVKGAENYPRYVPEGIKWWMLAGGVLVVLYLITLLLAVADRSKLDWAGYTRPAHWAWALLTAPVYLLVRTIAVKRETKRFSPLLLVWLLFAGVLVGGWFAANYLDPELLAPYTLPFL